MVESIDDTLKMVTWDLTCLSIYHYIFQLYKLTSVSLVTTLIEQDHFLYLTSFMDKYFSGNAFKFHVVFNLLTFNKIVLNLT